MDAFSTKSLDLGEENAMSFQVHDQRGRRYILRLRKWLPLVDVEANDFFNVLKTKRLLNGLISYRPSVNKLVSGPCFYNTEENRDAHPLPDGAEVWDGYYQLACSATSGKMVINIDVSATAVYSPAPLPELVVKILGRRSVDDMCRRGISARELSKLETSLKGCSVQVVKPSGRTVKLRVNKFDSRNSLQVTVGEKDDDRNVLTVATRHFKRYKRPLKHLQLPLVVCKYDDSDVHIPMEICQIVPGRPSSKKNDNQDKEFRKYGQRIHSPLNSNYRINQAHEFFSYQYNSKMKDFGVSISPHKSIIAGMVLSKPRILLGNGQMVHPGPSGVWNINGKKVAKPVLIKAWVVLNLSGSNVTTPIITQFLRQLGLACGEIGLPPIVHRNTQAGTIRNSLEDAYLKALNHGGVRANPPLILCILPNTGGPLYAEIKRISDTIIGVPTQCMQSKTVMEANTDICISMGLKINKKLGGVNWDVAGSEIPFVNRPGPCMVLGASIVHPAPGDMLRPSIAALSASMDGYASTFYTMARPQPSGSEIIADLANMVRGCTQSSKHGNPTRILYYRDCAPGDRSMSIMEDELPKIKTASDDFEIKPTISFIGVEKRHRSKFYPMNDSDADRTGDCICGTTIHTGIPHILGLNVPSFYLNSSGYGGFNKYCVYHDDNNMDLQSLQELTFKISFSSGIFTKPYPVVSSVWHANRVAERVKFVNWSDIDATSESQEADTQMSFAEVDESLQKVMYFM